MFFTTLVVMTVLCLAFPITRAYGIVGAGLLLYFNFYLALGLLAVAGITYYYIHRRKSHA